jgi:hypothetical protein
MCTTSVRLVPSTRVVFAKTCPDASVTAKYVLDGYFAVTTKPSEIAETTRAVASIAVTTRSSAMGLAVL